MEKDAEKNVEKEKKMLWKNSFMKIRHETLPK